MKDGEGGKLHVGEKAEIKKKYVKKEGRDHPERTGPRQDTYLAGEVWCGVPARQVLMSLGDLIIKYRE